MPSTSPTLLVSSAGRRVELIQCFRQSAADLGLAVRIVAADLNPAMSSACQVADAAFAVPACKRPDFIPQLLRLCAQEQVRLLVPTIDTELEILAAHKLDFAKIGTRVVISDPVVVQITRNKLATARFLAANNLPAPRTAALADFLAAPQEWRWPVILKPVNGSSTIGVFRLDSPDAALLPVSGPSNVTPSRLGGRRSDSGSPLPAGWHSQLSALPADYLVQEFWPGQEYTVHLYFDERGQLRCAIPYRRCEVRAGEVSKAITEKVPVLDELAQKLATAISSAFDVCCSSPPAEFSPSQPALAKAFGPLCFQAIVAPDGQVAMLEINARFGGGYPLCHQAGAWFSRWVMEESLGLACTAHNEWRAGVAMLRYDAAVFKEAK